MATFVVVVYPVPVALSVIADILPAVGTSYRVFYSSLARFFNRMYRDQISFSRLDDIFSLPSISDFVCAEQYL